MLLLFSTIRNTSAEGKWEMQAKKKNVSQKRDIRRPAISGRLKKKTETAPRKRWKQMQRL